MSKQSTLPAQPGNQNEEVEVCEYCGRRKKIFIHTCDKRLDLIELYGCPFCDDHCPYCEDNYD